MKIYLLEVWKVQKYIKEKVTKLHEIFIVKGSWSFLEPIKVIRSFVTD